MRLADDKRLFLTILRGRKLNNWVKILPSAISLSNAGTKVIK